MVALERHLAVEGNGALTVLVAALTVRESEDAVVWLLRGAAIGHDGALSNTSDNVLTEAFLDAPFQVAALDSRLRLRLWLRLSGRFLRWLRLFSRLLGWFRGRLRFLGWLRGRLRCRFRSWLWSWLRLRSLYLDSCVLDGHWIDLDAWLVEPGHGLVAVLSQNRLSVSKAELAVLDRHSVLSEREVRDVRVRQIHGLRDRGLWRLDRHDELRGGLRGELHLEAGHRQVHLAMVTLESQLAVEGQGSLTVFVRSLAVRQGENAVVRLLGSATAGLDRAASDASDNVLTEAFLDTPLELAALASRVRLRLRRWRLNVCDRSRGVLALIDHALAVALGREERKARVGFRRNLDLDCERTVSVQRSGASTFGVLVLLACCDPYRFGSPALIETRRRGRTVAEVDSR